MAIFKPTIWPSCSSSQNNDSSIITQYPTESEISCSHHYFGMLSQLLTSCYREDTSV